MARRTFICRYKTALTECVEQLLVEDAGPGHLQSILRRLETMESSLQWSAGRLIDTTSSDQLLDVLAELIQVVRSFTRRKQHGCVGCQAPQGSDRGRSHLITQEQLLFLTSCAFTAHQMAEILNVSVSTIRRRLKHFHLSRASQYAKLSDGALDEFVQLMVERNHPFEPEAVRASLQARGVRVPMRRVKACMMRINPQAAALVDLVRRRVYVG
ncbi:uncharacterized protein LOC106521312 [Austrofundulus limnaeus]|uniref:Uncharacterized protein LOC106521312 n=1 Tax=Austrofundulus limnaeus TaxID=52670 RepID=A0A2I4BNE4_AUSLI|nr:PREDICTED: uncharacterized protein LOC106521312 [Austrofundulus limnaeus]